MTPRPWNLGSRDGVRKGQTLWWPHNRTGDTGKSPPGLLSPWDPHGDSPHKQGVVTQPWGPWNGQEGIIKGLRLGPWRDRDLGGTEAS